jgi:hypothetical protein
LTVFWRKQPLQIFRILPRIKRLLLQQSLAIGCDVKSAIVKGVIVSINFGTKLPQVEGASYRLWKIRDVMDHQPERSAVKAELDEECCILSEVLGHGLFRMSPAAVPELRRKSAPIPGGWPPLPPSVLRNSDEQTIAGLCAVYAAISSMRLPADHCEQWGVIAASRFLGRANLARALQSFLAEGVWGTSPHLIPHFALHSASGTISLALGLHGPNLGVGGGLHAAAEGFLTALTWLASGAVAGVWLVLTGWSPELVPDRADGPAVAVECHALAIAMNAIGPPAGRAAIRVRFGSQSRRLAAPVDLVALAELLASGKAELPRTIATDPLGRLQIDLIEGPTGPG